MLTPLAVLIARILVAATVRPAAPWLTFSPICPGLDKGSGGRAGQGMKDILDTCAHVQGGAAHLLLLCRHTAETR